MDKVRCERGKEMEVMREGVWRIVKGEGSMEIMRIEDSGDGG